MYEHEILRTENTTSYLSLIGKEPLMKNHINIMITLQKSVLILAMLAFAVAKTQAFAPVSCALWSNLAAVAGSCIAFSAQDSQEVIKMTRKGGGSSGGSRGGSRGGAGQGKGSGNAGGWPSTTGNPSGGGRSNNPPSSK